MRLKKSLIIRGPLQDILQKGIEYASSGPGQNMFRRAANHGMAIGITFGVGYGLNNLYKTHTTHVERMTEMSNQHMREMTSIIQNIYKDKNK